MAHVVGAELGFETVLGLALGAGHDACVKRQKKRRVSLLSLRLGALLAWKCFDNWRWSGARKVRGIVLRFGLLGRPSFFVDTKRRKM